MSDRDPDLLQEDRAARHLLRLFRFERTGRFGRRAPAAVWRLVERRGVLLAELDRLERRRCGRAVPPSPELDAALRALRQEADYSRQRAAALLDALHGELRARRAGERASGLRDRGGERRLLGRG